MSSKRYVFTVNNPGSFRPVFDPAETEYLVYQLERGSEGTEHLQGYIRLKIKSRMPKVKRVLGSDHVHLETAKGTEVQNREYCTKSDTRIDGPFEYGTYNADAGRQGSRSDLTAVSAMVLTGAPLSQVATSHPEAFIKYSTGIERLIQLAAPPAPKKRDIFVHVLWGPTGTGKSHRVWTAYPDLYAVLPGRDPFGQYQREAVILFDEFDPIKWPINDMKKYIDVWPLSLDSRYVDKRAYWTVVFMISNSHPDTWYNLTSATDLDREAFRRRIHRITEVQDQETPIELVPPPILPPTDTPGTMAASTSAAPAHPIPCATTVRIVSRRPTPRLDPTDDEDPNPVPLKIRRTDARPDLSSFQNK